MGEFNTVQTLTASVGGKSQQGRAHAPSCSCGNVQQLETAASISSRAVCQSEGTMPQGDTQRVMSA